MTQNLRKYKNYIRHIELSSVFQSLTKTESLCRNIAEHPTLCREPRLAAASSLREDSAVCSWGSDLTRSLGAGRNKVYETTRVAPRTVSLSNFTTLKLQFSLSHRNKHRWMLNIFSQMLLLKLELPFKSFIFNKKSNLCITESFGIHCAGLFQRLCLPPPLFTEI